MSGLSKDQTIFLQLVERSMKGREWATVSDQLWNYTKTMQAKIPDLVEIDLENQCIRPSAEGLTVLKWL